MKKIHSLLISGLLGSVLFLSLSLNTSAETKEKKQNTENKVDIMVKFEKNTSADAIIKDLKSEFEITVKHTFEEIFTGASFIIPNSSLKSLLAKQSVKRVEKNHHLKTVSNSNSESGDNNGGNNESSSSQNNSAKKKKGKKSEEITALERIEAKLSEKFSKSKKGDKNRSETRKEKASSESGKLNLDDLPRGKIFVAVLDSGISKNARQLNVVKSTNLIKETNKNKENKNKENQSNSGNESESKNGHGTNVAGTISGFTFRASKDQKDGKKNKNTNQQSRDNGEENTGKNEKSGTQTGVAPKIGLLDVKIAGKNGQTTTDTILSGLDTVLQWRKNNPKLNEGTHVLNLSFASQRLKPGKKEKEKHSLDLFREGFRKAKKNGILSVVPAGNNGEKVQNENGIIAPAEFGNTLTVAAINHRNNGLAKFSNYGKHVDLVAPGKNVKTLAPNGTVVRKSGTSIATGYASGAAAIYQASLLAHEDTKKSENGEMTFKAAAESEDQKKNEESSNKQENDRSENQNDSENESKTGDSKDQEKEGKNEKTHQKLPMPGVIETGVKHEALNSPDPDGGGLFGLFSSQDAPQEIEKPLVNGYPTYDGNPEPFLKQASSDGEGKGKNTGGLMMGGIWVLLILLGLLML